MQYWRGLRSPGLYLPHQNHTENKQNPLSSREWENTFFDEQAMHYSFKYMDVYSLGAFSFSTHNEWLLIEWDEQSSAIPEWNSLMSVKGA